jgi:hypothetical protein
VAAGRFTGARGLILRDRPRFVDGAAGAIVERAHAAIRAPRKDSAMNKLRSMMVGALALAGCGGPAAEVVAPAVPPATEAEKVQAIALARQCWAREPWGRQGAGFALDAEKGEASQLYPYPTRFLVRLREGFYTGRLPPPRPLGDVWIDVDLAAKSCKASGPPAISL